MSGGDLDMMAEKDAETHGIILLQEEYVCVCACVCVCVCMCIFYMYVLVCLCCYIECHTLGNL
jgi:hypothetical protein